ncbi:MAG: transglutaminase-like domain-containing protein [Chloroflexi bacterium]|nr:transglutaminase-like domain-containing protein [Chloroflexota bacterium]MBU1662610.1 transglutaminase-like domain-containing protein [Chloroflexota bacterium]
MSAPISPRRLLTLTLLLVIASLTALRLADLIFDIDKSLMLTVAIMGVLIGWGANALSLSGWITVPLFFSLGLGFSIFRVGRLDENLARLFPIFYDFLRGAVLGPRGDSVTLSWSATLAEIQQIWSAISTLIIRVRDWGQAISTGSLTFDPAAAALAWSMALWMVSSWAGWMAGKQRQLFTGIAPTIALLAIVIYYADGSPGILLTLLFVTLLLFATLGHDTRLERWEAAGMKNYCDTGIGFNAAIVFSVLLVVKFAGAAPSISVQSIADFVRNLNPEQAHYISKLSDSLGVEQQSTSVTGGVGDAISLSSSGVDHRSPPRWHVIGPGVEYSQEVVMLVSTDDLLHLSLTTDDEDAGLENWQPPRYYWRSRVYDHYSGSGWYAKDISIYQYKGGQSIGTARNGQRTIRQTVQMLGDLGSMIYATGTLMRADQDYLVSLRPNDDVFGAIITADSYRVESQVNPVTEAQLRAAGTDYPKWILDRYLPLPSSVPGRVITLGRDLTATAPTPYDRAIAIESYLRTFPYSLDVPAPPRDDDVADYFLFSLQTGYCDYYATSMVVLARAAGLPARYVIGYASGQYDRENARYVVTQADAHAWVEIYFPEYGWVEFEPTVAQPAIHSAGDTSPQWDEDAWAEFDPQPPQITNPGPTTKWWFGLTIFGTSLILLGIVAVNADTWWLGRRSPAGTVFTLYNRLRRIALWLRIPISKEDTPYEFAATFTKWIEDMPSNRLREPMVFAGIFDIHQLIVAYVQASYSPHITNKQDQSQAIENWRSLRWQLWQVWVVVRLQFKN